MYLEVLVSYPDPSLQERKGVFATDKFLVLLFFNDGITVKPLNKGHFGANSFVPCREVVPISEVTLKY